MDKKHLKAQKRAQKEQKKAHKKAQKTAKRDARLLKIKDFFDLKFLRTKKFLAIKKNRATVKAVAVAFVWAVPLVLIIASIATLFFTVDAIITAALALVAVAISIVYQFTPKVVAPLVVRYKERYNYAVERAEAHKVYINKRQMAITKKMAKKHSKWSKKGNKSSAQIAKLEQKERAKEAKRLEKEKARSEAIKAQNNAFVGAIKENNLPEVNASIKK